MKLLHIIIFLCGIVSGGFLNIYIYHILLNEKVSKGRIAEYSIIKAVNGGMYLLIFGVKGIEGISLLYCLMASALLAASVVDIQTFEIPFQINVFIMALGIVRVIIDFENWKNYIIGFFAVSVVLMVLFIASNGRFIGGGDVKLTAACGFFLGWRLVWEAFFLSCIIGLVVHFVRMKINRSGKTLAMGPYLAAGVMTVILWGGIF